MRYNVGRTTRADRSCVLVSGQVTVLGHSRSFSEEGTMRSSTLATCALAAVFVASYIGATAAGEAGGYVETDLVVNKPSKTLTDKNGIEHTATNFDANLVNPWGISESTMSPFWVSDNGSGKSTLYNTPGVPQALVVSI